MSHFIFIQEYGLGKLDIIADSLASANQKLESMVRYPKSWIFQQRRDDA